jgi:hypothetical protein
MMQVEQLFKYMRVNAYNLKISVEEIDNQAFWTKFGNILGPYDDHHFTWKTSDNDEALDLIEYTVNGRGIKTLVEVAHFQIQCTRILVTELPCLRNLLQIAINLGQYDATMGKYHFSDYVLDSFISNEDLVDLNKKLPVTIFGEIQAFMATEFEKYGIDKLYQKTL